jgi:hypothetical protein
LPNDYKTSEDALMRGAPTVVHAANAPLSAAYKALAAQLGVGVAKANGSSNGKHAGHAAASKLGRLLSLGKR